MVVRKIKANHQSFVVGYDIEIYITATPPVAQVEQSFFIVS